MGTCTSGQFLTQENYCRYHQYSGIWSYGNQLLGEFGTGSNKKTAFVAKLDKKINFVGVISTLGFFISDSGSVYGYYESVASFQKLMLDFNVTAGEYMNYHKILTDTGNLVSCTTDFSTCIRASFRAEALSGVLLLSSNNVYYYTDEIAPTLMLVMNSTALFGSTTIAKIISSVTSKHYGVILSDGALWMWGNNSMFL